MTTDEHCVYIDIGHDVRAEIRRAQKLAREGKFRRAVSDPATTHAESLLVLAEEVRECSAEAFATIATILGLNISLGTLAESIQGIEQTLDRLDTTGVKEFTTWSQRFDDELVQVIAVATAWLIRTRLARESHDG